MKLKTIIIEDHKDSRELLQLLCSFIDEIEVVGSSASVPSGISLIELHQPDLVFLDVGLQQGNGFDLLDKVDRGRFHFHLIFTTGNADHAVNAIKHSADDYLLKPLKSSELKEAVSKLVSKYYYVTKGKRCVLISSIIYIRSRGNNVEYYTTDLDHPIVERSSLASIQNDLPSHIFHQVHRTFIVNQNHIKEINQSSLLLPKMHRIPVGEKYKSTISHFS